MWLVSLDGAKGFHQLKLALSKPGSLTGLPSPQTTSGSGGGVSL